MRKFNRRGLWAVFLMLIPIAAYAAASYINPGTLGSGTYSSSTYLAGNQTWQPISGVTGDHKFLNSSLDSTPNYFTSKFSVVGPLALSTLNPGANESSQLSITLSDASHNGYLSSSDWTLFNAKQPAGSYLTALTGDVSASGPGSAAATLATIITAGGPTGSSTAIPVITWDAKGRLTAVTTAPPAVSAVNGVSYPGTVNQGDLLYGSASSTISTLGKSITATRYLANTGTSNNPQWDQVNLTNGVTGNLPVGNGGTGASTASAARTNLGVAIGSDVEAYDATLAALAAYNTNGLLVQTSADTFTGRTLTGTSARISVSNGNGVSGNPTIDIDSSYVGQSSITTLGTIGTGTWQGTKVTEAYGGTNQASYTTGDMLYASATNTLSKIGIGSTNQVLTVSGGVPAWVTWATGLPAAGTANNTIRDTGSAYATSNALVNDGTNVNVRTKLGIGTTAPTAALYIDTSALGTALATNGAGAMLLDSNNGNGNFICRSAATSPFPEFRLQGGLGTLGSPTAITTNFALGSVGFGGYDGSTWQTRQAAIEVRASAAWNTSGPSRGCYMGLYTTDDADTTAAMTERVRISPKGYVGVGNSSPKTDFSVNGGQSWKIQSPSSPYTATVNDTTITMSRAVPANTITLTAANAAGSGYSQVLHIIITGSSGGVTINRAGSDTITRSDGTTGNTTASLGTDGLYIFTSDGSSVWYYK